jgi:serine protease Do
MTAVRARPVSRWVRLGLALLPAVLIVGLVRAEPPESVPDRPAEKPPSASRLVPENVDDLKALQDQVQRVVQKVMPCVVGVRIGSSQGSGVIINKEGHVLTAGHVSGKAGRDCFLILPDGKRLKGKTLGGNHGVDSGLIQITEEGKWPYVEMGRSSELKPGQWCVALGHPGGFRPGRTPVVRLGRVLFRNQVLIQTDCCLVGGDSGGPLFDLEGNVIGIHSRIGGPITANIHVPVDTYRDTWDRLVQGEVWGTQPVRADAPFLGVEGDLQDKECRIRQVIEGSPAEQAGLKAGDIVVKFDGREVASYEDLVAQIQKKKPGDAVSLEVRRGEESLTLKAVIGRRM